MHTKEEFEKVLESSTENVVVILSEKESPQMFYKTLAVRFSKYALKFVYIQKSNQDIAELIHDVSSYPSVAVYSDGDFSVYEDDLTERQELIDWLSEYAGDEVASTESEADAGVNSGEFVVKLKDIEDGVMSQVVAVTKDSTDVEVSGWRSFIGDTDSAVEIREVRCSSEEQSGKYFHEICDSSDKTIPYLLVLPYGAEKKKGVRHTCI